MTPSELLPCPFCASTDVFLRMPDGTHGCWIECHACRGMGPLRPMPEEARDAWNTRAQPPRPPQRLVLGEEEIA